jgi:thiol-disulfide isomerase/thioredoxin
MEDTLSETVVPEVDTEPQPEPAGISDEPKPHRDLVKPLLIISILLLIGVLTLQIIQLRQTDATSAEVAALAEDVTDLKPLRRDVDILGEQVTALGSQIEAAVGAVGASPASVPTQGPDGSLPIFEDTTNDPAVLGEMTLATINGTEYYSGEQVAWAPSDGKARVYLVWAHWCPYCQAELPALSTWYPENAARFPDVELLTVTTAIDETRDNPLLPYLDEQQFPFPVLVDETGELAALFGTAAFPFYVVTDSAGTVMLRVAGALGTDSVDQIFSQLETMTAG